MVGQNFPNMVHAHDCKHWKFCKASCRSLFTHLTMHLLDTDKHHDVRLERQHHDVCHDVSLCRTCFPIPFMYFLPWELVVNLGTVMFYRMTGQRVHI